MPRRLGARARTGQRRRALGPSGVSVISMPSAANSSRMASAVAKSRASLAACRSANLRATTLADRATVTGGDGLRQAASGPFDLVLLDPPYDTDRWDELLAAAAEGLAPGGVVVVESDREIAAPAALDAVRVRRYGSTVVTFLSTPGAPL